MTNNKTQITAGQLFTLIFVSRISLVFLYSAVFSGRESLWELLLPVMITFPVMLFILLPFLQLSRKKNRFNNSCVNNTPLSLRNKPLSFAYAVYFLYSSVYAVAALLSFMSYSVPDGVEPRLITALIIAGSVYSCIVGIEAAARMSAPVAVLIGLSLIIAFALLIPGYHSAELFSVRGITVSSVIEGTLFLISRADSLAAVYTLSGNTKGKIGRGAVTYLLVLTVLMVTMLILLQGSGGEYLKEREFQVYSGLESSGSLQRLDPLFIFVIVCSFFCDLSLLLKCAVSCLQAVFKRTSLKTLSLVCGAALLAASLFIDKGVTAFISNFYFKAGVNLVFICLIPLVVFAAQKIRTAGAFGKRALRFTALIVIIPLIVLVFTGCGSIQLNQRILIQGIGIDRQEDSYSLTFIALDADDTENRNSSRLLFSDGRTPEDAIANLENRSGKRTLFSQCLFIMLNEDAAKNSSDSLYEFSQYRNMRTSVNLMISEGSAEELLKVASEELNYKAEDINMISDSKAVDQSELHCSMKEYISSVHSDSAIMLPYVVYDEALRAARTDGGYTIDNYTHSFYRLSPDEIKGALMVNNKLGNYSDVTVDNLSFSLSDRNTALIPSINKGVLTVRVLSEIKLDEQLNNDRMSLVCDKLQKQIISCLEKTLHKYGSDVFLLQKQLYGIYKEELQKYDMTGLLKNSIISVSVVPT